MQELRNVAANYRHLAPEVGLTAFLEEVALVSDVDDLEETADAPVLMTLHMAKGLEFPTIFIVGLDEGILPHSRSLDDPDEMEEERRLCYVGITRAKERLYLVHAFRRTMYGESEVSVPSRFIADIPDHLAWNHMYDFYPMAVCKAGAQELWRKKPVVFFVGPVHGHEVEALTGLVNLIHIMETGRDLLAAVAR